MDPPTPGVPRPAKAQAAQKKTDIRRFVRRLAGLPALQLPLSALHPCFGGGFYAARTVSGTFPFRPSVTREELYCGGTPAESLPPFGQGALPLLAALRPIHPRIFRKSWKGFPPTP